MKYKYRIWGAITFLSELFGIVLKIDALFLFSIGALWFSLVLLYMVEATRFTDFWKAHYPKEYAELLERGTTIKEQLNFTPSKGQDEDLQLAQMRFQNLISFIPVAVGISALIPVVFGFLPSLFG